MNTGGYLVLGAVGLLLAMLVVAMSFSNRTRALRGADRGFAEEEALRAARPRGGGDVNGGRP